MIQRQGYTETERIDRISKGNVYGLWVEKASYGHGVNNGIIEWRAPVVQMIYDTNVDDVFDTDAGREYYRCWQYSKQTIQHFSRILGIKSRST